ncbi:hypothetical protein EXU48_24350 [Occultella glacieicola]|uniref:Uncharacterized protein n=1 Tax=Occultella glacieicola TaxID=2518684 RepID=A0ABY2DYI7_9MICO|nr:hypothetical protein [Occultella glacieicola]TDE88012.1 hypothetical protein EXU48_24350 [Occultella glacieicola]
MSVATLQQELSDPNVFAKRVKVTRGSTGLAALCLMIAAVLALWNLRSTLRTLDNDLSAIGSARFWTVFWSTNGADQVVSYWLYAVVYGPVVLGVIGLLALAYSLVSRRAAQRALYEDFRRRGYVAIGTPIGLSVRVDRKSPPREVHLLSHPSFSEQANLELAQSIQGQVFHGGPRVTQWEKDLRQAGVLARPVPADRFFPGTPPGPMLGTGEKLHSGVVVIDSEKPGGKPASYPLR